MKKKSDGNVLKIILIVVLVVAIIFILYNYATKDDVFNKYKENKSKNIVYTYYKDENVNVPYINLKGLAAEKINETIVNKANDFLKGDNKITYSFDINGKILSLAIQYEDHYDESKYVVFSYDVYNINFYENKVLSDEDILNIYNIKKSDVKPIVEAKFVEFYNELSSKGVYHDECDYSCFLYQRGITKDNYLTDSYYYIKNGDLYLLKAFKIYSPFREEEYFSTSDFLIQITE